MYIYKLPFLSMTEDDVKIAMTVNHLFFYRSDADYIKGTKVNIEDFLLNYIGVEPLEEYFVMKV